MAATSKAQITERKSLVLLARGLEAVRLEAVWPLKDIREAMRKRRGSERNMALSRKRLPQSR
jgi:hypothetical protein